MQILTIILPLTAALLILIIRRWRAGMAIAGGVGSLIFAAVSFWRLQSAGQSEILLPGLPGFPVRFLADQLSSQLGLLVAFVATFILVYARGYFAEEKDKTQFWAGMSLFVAAMQTLVYSNDWFSFITAWEVMGFASWLLIATHFRESAAAKGALKAFLLTRATDMGLYLGAIIVIIASGSSAITGATAEIGLWGGFAFLIAAMGKSAQVPFQSWLSAAMKGPTPVSALLHSATMVAAGVILMLRVFPLLPQSVLFCTGLVGGITILITGLSAMSFGDVKKMLAASTSSHFGFMLLAIGAGFPGAALLHLVAHAFMKSSLFLGAGIFQHGYASTEFKDLRGSGRKLVFSFILFAVAGISLAGIPPLVGFWSKDAVLAAAEKSPHHQLFFSMGLLGALFTGIYIARALRLLWKGEASEPKSVPRLNWMRVGMGVLVLVVLGGGFFMEHTAKLLDWEVPKSTLSQILGVSYALAGLAIGWWVQTALYLGPVYRWAKQGFRVGKGYAGIAGTSAMAAEYSLQRVESAFTNGVFRIGRGAGALADVIVAFDRLWENFNLGFGRLYVRMSAMFSLMDEWGFETSIEDIAYSIKNFGQSGRKLQSGLVHRELMLAVTGVGVVLVLLGLWLWM